MDALETVQSLVRERGLSLNQPLGLEAVLAFERRHGVTLPDEYRNFLLHVGDGGSGPPFYGLLPLGQTPARDVPAWFTSGYDGLLGQPFPLTRYWVWEDEEDTPELEAGRRALCHGNLCLGTDGCGIYWLLIVSGPERGQVWCLDEGCAQPLAPRLTFLPWYAYWLGGGDDWYREFVAQ